MSAATAPVTTLDPQKLEAFVGKVVGEFGVIVGAAMTVLGDKLGLYKALVGSPATAEELAKKTQTEIRYIRPWLVNQAAGGVLEYDLKSQRYTLPPEQATALTDEESPYCVIGGYQVLTAAIKSEPRIREAFKSGAGMLWGEHDADLFEGTERFFKPGYIGSLVSQWIPALDGVEARLKAGVRVADIGCGHGASTVLMAQAFPKSRFFGFDSHPPSIERARLKAEKAGVADRITFEVAPATGFGSGPFDFIAFFDCLHDMGDPEGALRHVGEMLTPDGVVMIVEPMAGDSVEGNFNPVGRICAGVSALVCSPNAVASGNTVLGTIATEKEIASVARRAGLSRFRRATETPLNRIFEAKK